MLILLTCGAMDLARVFFAGIAVEGAARAGVQQGSFSVGDAALKEMTTAADQPRYRTRAYRTFYIIANILSVR